MKNRTISFLLAMAMTASVLAGCAGSGATTAATVAAGTEKAVETGKAENIENTEAVTGQADPKQDEAKNGSERGTGTRIVVDHFGNEVEIPEQIERVVIVWLLPLPSVLAVYQGGNVDNLVGMPPDSLNAAEHSILAEYCPDILNVSTGFYKGGELNMEELLNLKPDVVFYSGAARAEIFRNAGIPAVGFSTSPDGNPSPIYTVGKWIELMEQVFQEESKTQGIMEYAKVVEDEIAKRVSQIPESERRKVLMIGHYTDAAITPGGKGSFSQYWCEAVGAECVALKAEQAEVNMEQIYEWEPDIVMLSTLAQFYPDDLYNNTAGTGHDWSTVPAVMNKAVYKFPLGTHRWWPPSSDAPLALWWVAKTTYPEYFEDIDMDEKIKEYYTKFYGMELSDQQVSDILHPTDELGRRFY